MTHYLIDERDVLFNLKECPGSKSIQALEAFEDFDDDTAEMIFEQAAQYCTKVLSPLYHSADREGCQIKSGEVSVPKGVAEAWNQYRELEFIGMNSTAEYGGAELPHFISTPVAELECGSCVAFSMLPMLTRGAARLILNFGSDAQKETFARRMLTGEWSGTMCLTEPGAGSDVGAGVTKAVPEGDHYKISGTKIFITWGEHNLSDNIVHMVLARIAGSPPGSKGLSLFIVPKKRMDGEGNYVVANDVVCGSIEHKMGINASPTCVMNFGSNDDCIGYLIGEPNQGMMQMFQMMNEARLEVGIQGMGIASTAYLSAVKYAKERTQGNRITAEGPRAAKIIEHPDVKRMLLKMRALSQGSRSLLYHMGLFLDLAHHATGEEAEKYQAFVELLTPISKSYCSDQGFRVAEMAVQTHGGYGYCQEYTVEQYVRDVKISSLYEGTNGIQAMDLLFRKILKNKGVYLKHWVNEVGALGEKARGTALADLGAQLVEAYHVVTDTVSFFGEQMKQGNRELVQFSCTEFQDNLGHLVVGYFLLKQALYAQEQLAGDVSVEDRSFYEQKLVTARFFCEDILPAAVRVIELQKSANRHGLTAVF